METARLKDLDKTGYSEVLEEKLMTAPDQWRPLHPFSHWELDVAPLTVPTQMRYLTLDEQRVLAKSLRGSVRLLSKGKKPYSNN